MWSLVLSLSLFATPQAPRTLAPVEFERPEALTAAQEAERIKQLQVKAKDGDADACFFMGNFHWQGRVVPKDSKAAMVYWRKAAQQDHIGAMWNLGSRLYSGEQGVRKDFKEARVWLEKAATKGHPKAMNRLAEMYEKGLGGKKDLFKAERLYTGAAKAGAEGASESLQRVLAARIKKLTPPKS